MKVSYEPTEINPDGMTSIRHHRPAGESSLLKRYRYPRVSGGCSDSATCRHNTDQTDETCDRDIRRIRHPNQIIDPIDIPSYNRQ